MANRSLLALSGIMLLLLSCADEKANITPIAQNITESVYASGLVKSKNQYEVFSKTGGLIKEIYVKEGDTIRKGDKLFLIENNTTRFSTENARIAADAADYSVNADRLKDAANAIELAQKKLNSDSLLYVRQKNLWDQNIGSRVELEQKELNYENARTALASAKVKYGDLQRQLKLASMQSKNNFQIAQIQENDLIVKSDVNGLIYKLNKEQGEMVNNQTAIAVVGDASEFIVELNVDEFDIVKIHPGQQVIMRMDSYKGRVFEGVVTSVDPMMNERTRTFTVEASFVAKPEELYPNLTLEANIVISTKQNVLAIPRNYLLGDTAVFLEDGSLRKVETGLMDYNVVEIIGGISADTKIVLPEK